MKTPSVVAGYQIVVLVAIGALWCFRRTELLASVASTTSYHCALWGAVGGTTYCLRAVYRHRCVDRSWDSGWALWYFVRPIVSFVAGLVAYVFLAAGLLVLNTRIDDTVVPYGYFAVSLIAGYNVDGFMSRMERLAGLWGIKKSRVALDADRNRQDLGPDDGGNE